MENRIMKCTLAATVLIAFASISSIPTAGCSTVGKVRNTLALNDIHIQAGIAEDKGDYERAFELWSEYVDRRPHSVLAEYRLGKVETRLGYYEQAISHLRVAHDLKPGNIEYLEALADALVLANRTDSLMSLLRETVNEGEEGSGYYRLARYSQELGMMDEAREALDQAVIHANGQSPDPYLQLAQFSKQVGDRESEILNLRKALWFDRSSPSIKARLIELGMIPGPSLAMKP